MHYFKFNIGDYHKKAGRLTMLEHGAYTLLLHACYDREKFPTKEEAIDWCWARTQDEVAAVEFVLSKFFQLKDGVYVQDRIQEEIDSFHAKSEKNKHIALEREAARRTKRARSVNDSSPQQHEAPPNQEPLTTNQEPKEEQAPAKAAARSPSALGAVDLVADGLTETTAIEWLAHRKRVKAPMTPRAWEGIKSQAALAGMPVEDAVLMSLRNGWRGFEASWVRGRSAPARPSAHSGFDNVDYRKGINDDGSFA